MNSLTVYNPTIPTLPKHYRFHCISKTVVEFIVVSTLFTALGLLLQPKLALWSGLPLLACLTTLPLLRMYHQFVYQQYSEFFQQICAYKKREPDAKTPKISTWYGVHRQINILKWPLLLALAFEQLQLLPTLEWQQITLVSAALLACLLHTYYIDKTYDHDIQHLQCYALELCKNPPQTKASILKQPQRSSSQQHTLG